MVAPKGEAPTTFHYWSAVAAVAGSLRRRVWIDEGSYRYFCHMYIILDGPPGIKKSTAINQVMDILQDVPGVKFGSDCATWQEFVQQVEDAKDVFAEAGQQSKSLLDREYTVTCAITLGLSEFGTFFNPQIPEMVSTLTGLWDGLNNRAWVKATKTQGDNVLDEPVREPDRRHHAEVAR
jgi:hypothetical protein